MAPAHRPSGRRPTCVHAHADAGSATELHVRAPDSLPPWCVSSRDAHDVQDRSQGPVGAPTPTPPRARAGAWSCGPCRPRSLGYPATECMAFSRRLGWPGCTSQSSSERSQTETRRTPYGPSRTPYGPSPRRSEPDDAGLGAGGAREGGVRRPPRCRGAVCPLPGGHVGASQTRHPRPVLPRALPLL